MESQIKIKATVPQMSEFFEKDGGVRYYEIKDKRYSEEDLKAMPEDKYNSEVFTFAVRYRHMELEKPLTGTFTIDGLTKTMEAFKDADRLLHAPVYRNNSEYAREHNELELYRASSKANTACKEAIEKAISEHYYDNVLHKEAVAQVAEKFGYRSFAEQDTDKIGFIADGITPLRVYEDGATCLCVFPKGTIVIERYLRRENESGRRRFTISHECAHYLMDKTISAAAFHREFDGERAYTTEDFKNLFSFHETLIDRMGAALLMPRFMVHNVVAMYGFSEGRCTASCAWLLPRRCAGRSHARCHQGKYRRVRRTACILRRWCSLQNPQTA